MYQNWAYKLIIWKHENDWILGTGSKVISHTESAKVQLWYEIKVCIVAVCAYFFTCMHVYEFLWLTDMSLWHIQWPYALLTEFEGAPSLKLWEGEWSYHQIGHHLNHSDWTVRICCAQWECEDNTHGEHHLIEYQTWTMAKAYPPLLFMQWWQVHYRTV